MVPGAKLGARGGGGGGGSPPLAPPKKSINIYLLASLDAF